MDKIEYLNEFENKVIIEGFKKGVFGKRIEEIVPLRNGKLTNTGFGSFIGRSFKCGVLLSINYYGLFKLSEEIINLSEKAGIIFSEIRSVKSPVIHFNSIKLEQIKLLAPELLQDYDEFKKYVVNLRWHEKE